MGSPCLHIPAALWAMEADREDITALIQPPAEPILPCVEPSVAAAAAVPWASFMTQTLSCIWLQDSGCSREQGFGIHTEGAV